MAITASLVKELRERTGVGMMECKKALVEAEGDIEVAAEILRKSGLAKADKKSGRIAAEGLVAIIVSDDNKSAAMVEINSETDFLAKADEFINFSNKIAKIVLNNNPDNINTLNNIDLNGDNVETNRQNLIAKLGENVSIRRFAYIAGGVVSAYSHGGKIGALVCLSKGTPELARDIALHVAAMKPIALDESSISPDILAKEKEIFVAQAIESGKPVDIAEKMTIGRMRKFINENTLLGQSFVKNPDITIEQLIQSAGVNIISFERLEVGEGIEKKTENFADEVMAQIK